MPDVPLDTNTRLAIERTQLAVERTLMAWIRTAIALVGFGFTIYKFSDFLASERRRDALGSSWIVALTMIVLGLIALVLATVQHRRQIARLRARDPELPASLAGPMSGLIAVLGVLTLVLVIARV